MNRFPATAALLLCIGCVAAVTPEGTYVEPLPVVVVGPPVVAVAPPPPVIVERLRPLPPVSVSADRHIYAYGGLYYYHWEGRWYYGPESGGPWYRLPEKYHPRDVRRGPPHVPPGHRKKR